MASEFGNGTTYCLGMFLAHQFQFSKERFCTPQDNPIDMTVAWFNASSDHLYGLQMTGDNVIDRRLKILKDKCLNWGHGFPKKQATKEDREWAITEAKKILKMIDKRLLKVETETAQWD